MTTPSDFCTGDTVVGAPARTGGPQSVNLNTAFGLTAAADDWPVADDLLPSGQTLDYTGVADCSTAVRAVHDAALAAGYRCVRFRNGTINAPSLTGACNVIFVGNCTLKGAYRKNIIPDGAASPPAFSDVSPSRHLKKFNAAVAAATSGAPAVAVCMGDSITVGGNALTPSERYFEHLRRRMQQQYGADMSKIALYNRGIGSTTWVDANASTPDPASAFPVWYANQSKAWLSYVQDLAPDWIHFAFGENDRDQFDLTQMQSVIAAVKTWSKVPDMTFATAYCPSYNTENTADNPGSSFMEGRDFVSGYTRTYTIKNGYGLFDWGRQMNLVRDGADDRNQLMMSILTAQSATLPYAWPQSTPGDFAITLTIPATIWATGQIPVQLSSKAGNVLLLEKDSGTGNVAFTVNAASGVVSGPRTVSSIAAPASTFLLDLVVKEGFLYVAVGGNLLNGFPSTLITGAGQTLCEIFVERHGGIFTPSFGGSGQAGIAVTLANVAIGQKRLYMPAVIDKELFGNYNTPGTSNLTILNYGGNSFNHMSSYGSEFVHAPIYNATLLAA